MDIKNSNTSKLIKTNAKATICVANYKMFDLTQLCLRSIRKFTLYPYEAIVIDNNSQDESLEYLNTQTKRNTLRTVII